MIIGPPPKFHGTRDILRTINKMIELRWVDCYDGRYYIGTRLVERATLARRAIVRNADRREITVATDSRAPHSGGEA